MCRNDPCAWCCHRSVLDESQLKNNHCVRDFNETTKNSNENNQSRQAILWTQVEIQSNSYSFRRPFYPLILSLVQIWIFFNLILCLISNLLERKEDRFEFFSLISNHCWLDFDIDSFVSIIQTKDLKDIWKICPINWHEIEWCYTWCIEKNNHVRVRRCLSYCQINSISKE